MIGSNKLYEPVIGGDVNEEVKNFKLFSKKKVNDWLVIGTAKQELHEEEDAT